MSKFKKVYIMPKKTKSCFTAVKKTFVKS